MAEIVKNSNHLRKDIRITNIKLALTAGLVLISVFLLEITYYLALVPIGILLIWGMMLLNHLEILRFGMQGEKEVLDLLDRLPGSYKVLSDVHIVDGDKSSQIDFVIVGKNGVFIMESKHIKGVITGKEDDNYIQRIKTSKSGDKYYKKVFNPVRQISGHKIGMDVFLKKKGIRATAFPILYFSNDCIVNVKSKKVKIITEPVLVIDYIKRYNESKYLSDKVQQQIIDELSKLG